MKVINHKDKVKKYYKTLIGIFEEKKILKILTSNKRKSTGILIFI